MWSIFIIFIICLTKVFTECKYFSINDVKCQRICDIVLETITQSYFPASKFLSIFQYGQKDKTLACKVTPSRFLVYMKILIRIQNEFQPLPTTKLVSKYFSYIIIFCYQLAKLILVIKFLLIHRIVS